MLCNERKPVYRNKEIAFCNEDPEQPKMKENHTASGKARPELESV